MTAGGERPAPETEGIVVTSRVRLARNIEGFPFPGWSRKPERLRVLEKILPTVEALPEMKGGASHAMDALAALDKQVLVEKHLISREHAGKNVGSAVVINRSETLAVMLNEEDHLRMQAIRPGFCLEKVYALVNEADTRLEEALPFAFSSKLGYLTACPTNVGTGMRASAMLHLPALVLADHMSKIISAVNKLGLAVRGLYGEGTEALGNLFQISNQMTLGEREADILGRLKNVVSEIARHEINARATLLEKSPRMLYDHIGRAYGVLAHARVISSKEGMNLLSMIHLGVALGAFGRLAAEDVDRLFMETQPAHLQRGRGRSRLSAEERDALRADLIRSVVGRGEPPKLDIPPPTGESPKTT
ncbi:MAG: protein arginine kinase [Verrucomicrobiae bacterium]|nr:protein arginine kinase [Verrucomicrobiae bacterium]